MPAVPVVAAVRPPVPQALALKEVTKVAGVVLVMAQVSGVELLG